MADLANVPAENRASGTSVDPSFQFINVTPSDTLPLKYYNYPKRTKYISFAVAGALAIKDDGGTTVIIPSGALVAGVMHKLSTNQILSTGTGATGIVAYF